MHKVINCFKENNPVINNNHLAGIHFTGSTEVFQDMWKRI